MKKYIAVLCFFIMVMGITGCGRKKQSPPAQVSGNPFDLEEEDAQNVEASYGWGICNYDSNKREISYDGKMIPLEISFDVTKGKGEVGLLLFVDGIMQKYTIAGESQTEKYINTCKISQKMKKKTVTLNMIPQFGTTGKNHELQIACMYEPSYRASKENMGYGNYQNILTGLPWTIHYPVEQVTEKISVCKDYKPIPEEIVKEYKYERKDGTLVNQLENQTIFKYRQSGRELEDLTVNCKKPLTYQIFGGVKGTYRICVLLNNEPIPVFGDSCYVDISLGEEQMAVEQIRFDKMEKHIKKYDSLSMIVCPVADNDSQQMLEKSNSLIMWRQK